MSVSTKILESMHQSSWIRRMFEDGLILKKKFGENNVFDFSLGNPNVEPPAKFYKILRELSLNPPQGIHRYMPNAGYVKTRDAIAKQLSKETNILFNANHITMTCGTGGGLNVIIKTLVNPKDEILIFSPYFVEYLFYIDNHNAKHKIVPTDKNFLPNINALEKAITKKTKMVIINSPNNPSGVVYNENVLSSIGKIIQEKEKLFDTHIYLVSDEPYRKILFDNLRYPQVFPHHIRTIITTSHSKDLALAGERIGYIAINPSIESNKELSNGLTFSNRILGFVNAPALMQNIIPQLQVISVDILDYQNKRDILYNNLTSMGYSIITPQGAFYIFPKSPIKDDILFAEKLREEKILVVPGSGFGKPGYFRIAYCVDTDVINRSLNGFSNVLKKTN